METKRVGGLAAKMSAAMGEIGRVQKRGRNQAQGYSYARADDVAEEARAVLSRHGIAVFASVAEHGVREVEGKNGKIRISTATVEWTFRDGESGEERTVKIPGEGQDSGDKGIYKAMTGSLKYALMLGFLIPTGDGDPERDEEDEPPRRDTRQARANVEAAAEVLGAKAETKPVDAVRALWDRAGEQWPNDKERKQKFEGAVLAALGPTPPKSSCWTAQQIAAVDEALFGANDVKF